MQRSRKKNRIGVFERLEDRMMLSGGNVATAYDASSGLLELWGDHLPNAIDIYQVDSRREEYVIKGVGRTTVDGEASVSYTGVVDVRVDMGRGVDLVQVKWKKPGWYPTTIPGNLGIHMGGNGSDRVNIGVTGRRYGIVRDAGDVTVGGNIRITGARNVHMAGVHVGGDVTVDLGSRHGSKFVFENSTRHLAATGDIRGGGWGSRRDGLSRSVLPPGRAGVIGGDLTVTQGSLKAEVILTGSRVLGNTVIDTGAGNDIVSSDQSFFYGDVRVTLGNGNDRVTLGQDRRSIFRRSLDIFGGRGSDTVQMPHVIVYGPTLIDLVGRDGFAWGGVDTVGLGATRDGAFRCLNNVVVRTDAAWTDIKFGQDVAGLVHVRGTLNVESHSDTGQATMEFRHTRVDNNTTLAAAGPSKITIADESKFAAFRESFGIFLSLWAGNHELTLKDSTFGYLSY